MESEDLGALGVPSRWGPAVDATPPAAVAETHSAWVIFVGDRAYKIKKPVDLGFLDFRSRESRARIAHREVELNRRLAPDVYLGVADLCDADGRPFEHAVVMRRLPEHRRLGTLVDAGVPVDDEVRDIARAIARFHASAATSEEITTAGSPEALRSRIDADLSELRGRATGIVGDDAVDELTARARRYLAGRGPLLEQRAATGRIRDGHGDLLADDVFCLPDGPRILDCLEFDDRLRYGDVLADVAFLAMDLEARGHATLAERLVDLYVEFSGEHHPQSLADYYVAQRAIVRAEVSCIRAEQGDQSAIVAARTLTGLALEHLRRGRIRLVLIGGPPGTGKSTLAAGLGDALGWVVLRSDEIRKDLTGTSHERHPDIGPEPGIYDAATTRATYGALVERAQRMLELGESVILDASWSRASDRDAAAAVAVATSSDLVELRCDVTDAVAGARVARRLALGTDASDADEAIATRLRADFEPWPGATVVATDAPAGLVTRDVLARLTAPPDQERRREERPRRRGK